MNEVTLIRLLRHALKGLSDRLLTILVFCAAAGAGSWAMTLPDLHRDFIATGFGVLYLLTLHAERREQREPAESNIVQLEASRQ